MFDAVLCLAANAAGKCVSQLFVSWLSYFFFFLLGRKEKKKRSALGQFLLLDMKTFSFFGLKTSGGEK